MKDFQGKVAVITGAAHGLGRALAERSAQVGMKVVLADLDEQGLAQAEKELKAAGASALPVVTDVSKVEEVQALAQKTLEAFGSVDLLCNAAAVHRPAPLAEASLADWQWVAGTNLFGPVYTLAVFLPTMIQQDTEGHIVNVAPVLGGFYALPFNGLYNVSEFGLVNLSETIAIELGDKHPKIGVTLLAPDYADTSILDCEQYRPAGLPEAAAGETGGGAVPHLDEIKDLIRATAQAETPPERLADMTFDAIRENKFYVFPHPSSKVLIRKRLADVDQATNPDDILTLMGVAV